MNITDSTPRVARKIGGKTAGGDEVSVTVQVPQPYAPGARELTEGEASALNQIVAENLSNNLRQKIVDGQLDREGKPTGTAHTDETAQVIVDEYLAEYELGVRRAGSGEPRVTDPVEREARRIAREKAKELIKAQGGKPSDYDLAPITQAIFDANKDVLMKEGKRIVDAAKKARENAEGGLSLEGIDLTPKAASAAAEPAEATAYVGTALSRCGGSAQYPCRREGRGHPVTFTPTRLF